MLRQTSAVILLLLCLIGGLTLYFVPEAKVQSNRFIEQILAVNSQTTEPVNSAASLKPGTTTLRLLRAHHRDDFLIQPDRRFVLALKQIQRLSGQTVLLAEPSFDNQTQHWQWLLPNGEKIALPKLADFATTLQVLQQVARTAVPQMHLVQNQTPECTDTLSLRYRPTELWQQLQHVETEWQPQSRSSVTLAHAASILAYLAVLSVDDLEIADSIPANALALLALAQTACKQPLLEATSQVANSMGYRSYALQIAQQLPLTNNWRLYIERQQDTLAQAVSGTPITQRDDYLLIKLLSENNDLTAWTHSIEHQSLDSTEQFCSLATSFQLVDFYPRDVIARHLHHLILAHLLKQQGKLTSMLSLPNNDALLQIQAYAGLAQYFDRANQTVLEQFEAWLQLLAEQQAGQLLTADLYQDFYRGYFYSGLYQHANHLLNRYGSVEATKDFAKTLGQTDKGIGKDFRLWLNQIIKAHEGEIDTHELLAELTQPTQLGPKILEQTWFEYLQRLPYASAEAAKATTWLTAHLDSRISHRHLIADILYRVRLDLAEAEAVYTSIVRDNSEASPYWQAWLANFTGDELRLFDLAANHTWTAEERAYALAFINVNDTNRAKIDAAFQALPLQGPKSWQVVNNYVSFLTQTQQDERIINVLTDWLKQNPDAFELLRLSARVKIARALIRQNKVDLAWQLAEHDLTSWYGPTLKLASDIHLLRKDYDAAETQAKAALARYSDSFTTLLNLVDVYWASNRYDLAASTIKTWKPAISLENWRWEVGETFTSRFATQPPQQALAAFTELVKKGIDPVALQQVASAMAHQQHWEAAYLMQSQLRVAGPGYAEMLNDSYEYLSHWQGQSQAEQWLNTRIPKGQRNFMSMVYLADRDCYPLLWTMIPNPAAEPYAQAVWLARATAKIDGAVLTEAQNAALTDYYAQESNDYYDRLGRLLMGKLSVEQFLDIPMPEKQIQEAAFYLGLLAESNKHYEEAAEWYITTIRTHKKNAGEYRWAYDRLYRWRNEAKSLAYLAKTNAAKSTATPP